MAKIAPSLFMALLVCGSSKPAHEQLHRSEIEPDLTAGDGGLKVFGEAAVAVEPSEGSSTTQRRVRTRDPAQSDPLTISIHHRPCPASAEASLSRA